MATKSYEMARQAYKNIGVDTDMAIARLANIPISIHCWQGDDVGGFERPSATLSGGGIQVTGNYPGKARSLAELRQDLEKVYALVPGPHRLNLHASYGEFGDTFVDRDAIEVKHFAGWVEWAKELGIGIDFNGTFFSHPMADSGYTLSSKDPKVRAFWIEHAKRCRAISAWIGEQLGTPCVLNTWIPDGAKDLTVDKIGYRRILKDSLDDIFSISYPSEHMRDAVETKLFGIGSEAFVVGSHEFYMNYAAHSGKMLCVDMGHFHVEEDVSDKLSSILLFQDEILLHVSRPLHWDSDHVVLFTDKVRQVALELVRSGKLEQAHIGVDYFDASINRIGAWATGARSLRKALLFALLEPHETLLHMESTGKGYAKMGLMEALHTMPFGAVWEAYCERFSAPDDLAIIEEVASYENEVLKERI
ncbi:L-rhamnose isomerase [Pleomorphochaeta sp. DL1XJH-081]|uniref:L-rhamnose isomerase n=1 Tax=Pleomorphochaeta sp. DL1XJH-081 TaxID=3409690 RepID=UPI003BB753CC